MKKSLIFAGVLSIGFAYAQEGNVGINTDQPKATLDIQPNATNLAGTTNQGILAPRLSKVRIANIEAPVQGTLVYVLDENSTEYPNSLISAYTGADAKVAKITEKGYYFYNGQEWVKTSTSGIPWIYSGANNDVSLNHPNGNVTELYSSNQHIIKSKGLESYTDVLQGTVDTVVPFPNPQADTYSLNLFGYDASKITRNSLIPSTSMSFSKGYNVVNGNIDNQFKTIDGQTTYTLIDKTNSYDIDRFNGSVRYTSHIGTGKVKNLVGSTLINSISKNASIDESRALATQINYTSDKNAKKLIGVSGYVSPRGGSGQIDRIMAIEAVTGTNINIKSNSNILNIDNINSNIQIHSNYEGNIGTIKGLNIEYDIASSLNDDKITNNYGIYVNDVTKGQNKYSLYTNSGQVRLGDLAQTGAGDRVVYADENGVLKTGVSAAANVKLATANNVECTEANTGTMNFGSVTINGKATEAFGFCMKNSTGEYKWYYIYGGAGITTGSGAFGSNL